MPTGVAMHDARQQLFDAAERILQRSGPDALTSRSVTDEAGCAKGVLHRHFTDFDTFLAELVYDRAARMELHAIALSASVGTGTVADNLTEALTAFFSSVAVSIVALVTFREELRARLRETWPVGVPLLTEAVTTIAAYLMAERELHRIPPDADIETIARTLVGAAHLLFADRTGTPPNTDAVHRMVTTVL